MQEPSVDVLDMSDYNEYAIAAMLDFMYHDSYDSSVLPRNEEEVFSHINVFFLACNYSVTPLQTFAQKKILGELTSWNTLVFAQALKKIYTLPLSSTETSVIRAAAVSIVHDNAAKIFCPVDKAEHRLVRETFEEAPGFMSELAAAMACHSSSQSETKGELRIMIGELEGIICRLQDDNDALGAQQQPIPPREYILPIWPRGADDDDKPKMKWYKCPNCNTVFVRSIWPHTRFTHDCYSAHWFGAWGRSTVNMHGFEWDNHLYRQIG